jgi:hypothetical protein
MNGLYPIIRRVRRPLLPVEAAAEAKPEVRVEQTGQKAKSADPGVSKAKESYGKRNSNGGRK